MGLLATNRWAGALSFSPWHYVHVPIDAKRTCLYVRGTLNVDRFARLKSPRPGGQEEKRPVHSVDNLFAPISGIKGRM